MGKSENSDLKYRRRSLLKLLLTISCLIPAATIICIICPHLTPAEDKIHIPELQQQLQQAKKRSAKVHPKLEKRLHDIAASLASQVTSLKPGSTQQKIDFSRQSTPFVHVNKDGDIQVYIYVSEWGETERSALAILEVRVEIAMDDLGIIQAWVPYDRLEETANLPFITRITPPRYGKTQSGSVVTEGDAILNADDIRALGFTGSGVNVGVISGGVEGLAFSQQSGDLPDVAVVQAEVGDAEGTAMLEIVHDMAPNAALGFCGTPSGTSLDFIFCVYALRENFGADIIVDDIGFNSEPYFEDGNVAVAVKSAVDSGVFYTSAAGNDADKHYEANYLDFSGFHNFGGRAGTLDDIDVDFLIPPMETLSVWLQWNEHFGGSCSDYDLALFDEFFNILDSSLTIQNCDDDPLEFISYTNPYISSSATVHLVVEKYSGANRKLEMFYTLPPAEYAIHQGNVFGHKAIPGVMSVGAINANDPGHDTIETYSSRGPSEIYYPSHQLREKPDITAIDGVAVTGAGGFPTPFNGTSAAAPHVAGIAALLISVNPTATTVEISQAIKSTAIDLGNAGQDRTFGYGLIDALAVVQQLVDIDGDAILDQNDNCPTVANPNQLNTDGDGLGNVCDPDDDNDGMPDTYEISMGFNPLNPSDASADADGDGYSNVAEYEDGSDPHDPQSIPRIRFLPWLPLLLD
jgi:subtilisin family serine protease